MKLNQQVCSLELAKKLKELGVKQESFFVWSQVHEGFAITRRSLEEEIAAFTVAELGEMLPVRIDAKGKKDARQRLAYYLDYQAGGFSVCYSHHLDIRQVLAEVSSDTEADARAKCLIYLLENKLITV